MCQGGRVMPVLAVSEAKNKLTTIRREALTGKEFLLSDAKRKEDQPVSLIATSLLDELCDENKTFTYEWTDIPVSGQEYYTLWNHETGVYGAGKTKTEAVEDYIGNIEEYTDVYFNDLPYYLSPSGNTRSHYWYLRRVARCRGDKDALYKALALEEIAD